MGSGSGLSNRRTFGLANQQAGSYAPATELYLISFWPLPFGELVWHLITQGNDGGLAAYITVFDPRRGKRMHFITFLVYALFYPSVAINLVNLDTLSPRYYSVYAYTLTELLRKPFLM